MLFLFDFSYKAVTTKSDSNVISFMGIIASELFIFSQENQNLKIQQNCYLIIDGKQSSTKNTTPNGIRKCSSFLTRMDFNNEDGELNMPMLKYFGHASFKFYSQKISVVFDPGILNDEPLVPESETTNIICVSHAHRDHLGNTAQLSKKQKAFVLGNEYTIETALKEGTPQWLVRKLKSGEHFERPNVKVTAVDLKHGPSVEPVNIPNLCFIVEIEGVRVAHLGDAMTKGFLEQYPIDVLLIGVDETEAFTSSHSLSAIADIKPHLAIPMHVRTEDEIDYFFTHAETVAPDTKFKKLNPGEEIRVEWLAGTEFRVS